MDRVSHQLGAGMSGPGGQSDEALEVFWDVSCWLFMNECDPVCLLKAERQRRLERIKHKQSQLQELILQVHRITSCLSELCVQQHTPSGLNGRREK